MSAGRRRMSTVLLAASGAFLAAACAPGQPDGAAAAGEGGAVPIVLETQGSFAFGGTVVTGADGNTFRGDHGYAQFQVPANARSYPLVMWHGGGQFSKTWETTPDGRDGFQNIFLRRGFATCIIDQPRRGRAGRSTAGATIPDAPRPTRPTCSPSSGSASGRRRSRLASSPAFSFRRTGTPSTSISGRSPPIPERREAERPAWATARRWRPTRLRRYSRQLAPPS